MDTGRFPDEDEGLLALIVQPSDVTVWEPGGYLETTELPLDGWNNEFIYELFPESGAQFAIRSMGPDGEEGTEDDLLSTDAY
jgi:general secretion pathway protein G